MTLPADVQLQKETQVWVLARQEPAGRGLPVMEQGHDQLQKHGSGGLGGRPRALHALVHRAALPQDWWGLYGCGSQQALQAVAQHIQHALAGRIECLACN